MFLVQLIHVLACNVQYLMHAWEDEGSKRVLLVVQDLFFGVTFYFLRVHVFKKAITFLDTLYGEEHGRHLCRWSVNMSFFFKTGHIFWIPFMEDNMYASYGHNQRNMHFPAFCFI